jgi:hypothetical protein
MARRVGGSSEARRCFERGLELAREADEGTWESLATGNLAANLQDAGRWREALEVCERHLALVRRLGFRGGTPHSGLVCAG